MLVVSCRTEVTVPIREFDETGMTAVVVVETVKGVFRDRVLSMEEVLMLWLVAIAFTEELFKTVSELGGLWLRLAVIAAELEVDLVLVWLGLLEDELDDTVVFG